MIDTVMTVFSCVGGQDCGSQLGKESERRETKEDEEDAMHCLIRDDMLTLVVLFLFLSFFCR